MEYKCLLMGAYNYTKQSIAIINHNLVYFEQCTYLLRFLSLSYFQSPILDDNLEPNIFRQYLIRGHEGKHATDSLSQGHLDFFRGYLGMELAL